MGQKGFSLLVILVGIAILVILVGGGYFYLQNPKKNSDTKETITIPGPSTTNISTSPSPNPTTAITNNWKNYTDKENGYSFSYPPNWDIIQATPDNLIIANFESTGSSGALDPIKDRGKGSISFTLTKADNPLSLKDYVQKKIKDLEDYEGKKDYQLKEFSIDDKSAIIATKPFNFSDLESSNKVYIEYSPSKYLIVGPNIDFPSYEEDFNKIIQTIKFDSPVSGKISPNGTYIINEETVGDGQTITLKDSSGNIISQNIIEDNKYY